MSEATTPKFPNTSGLKPLGRAVLVRPDEVEEVSSGGILIPRSTVNQQQMAEQRATVIEVGPTAWSNEPVPRAKGGDRILFSKWAGYDLTGPADGGHYRVVNDSDIFLQITSEADTK